MTLFPKLSQPSTAQIKNNQTNENGNVFFYILLAVMLFAALSYALSDDRSGNVDMFQDESAKVAAQEIIEYGNTLANAVQRLKLRGCSDTEISFANDVYTSHSGTIAQPDGHNPNAPTDGTCDVFKPAGGDVIPLLYPDNATVNWTGITSVNSFRGSSRIRRAAVEGVGDAGNEEIIMTGAYITDEVCMAMNTLLGITNPSGKVPEATNSLLSLYTGLFTDDGSRYVQDDDGVFAGKTTFCTRHPTTNAHDNFNVHVLLVR